MFKFVGELKTHNVMLKDQSINFVNVFFHIWVLKKYSLIETVLLGTHNICSDYIGDFRKLHWKNISN